MCVCRTNGVYRLSVRHEPVVVLEHSAGMEQRQSYSHDALQPLLPVSQWGAGWVGHLVKQLVLTEGEHRDQLGPEDTHTHNHKLTRNPDP